MQRLAEMVGKKVVGDRKWYLRTINESCVQNSLDAYLADYPYLDGYTPSQLDIKVHEAVVTLGSTLELKRLPHLRRWREHMRSFGPDERREFRVEDRRIMSYCEIRIGGGGQVGENTGGIQVTERKRDKGR